MTEFLDRILVIVRTDVLFRFRRTATVVTLLIVAASVYFIVPDVSTGRTLMQVAGSRVIYNSAAVALGTSMFCALFLSLFGFYLVSNSIRRDILSRTGFIIAASPITNTEYIVGKFVGNVLYLAAIMLTCMASAMVMFLIRGEGSLQPFVFLETYLSFVLPSIVLGSAAALAFEALPSLSGRVGDVVYFFVWGALLGLPASMIETTNGPDLLRILDVIGFVPMMEVLRSQFHTNAMSIGASTFNASRPPVLFPGIDWSWSFVGQRFATFSFPLVLLIGARTWFHRFNPTRIKSSSQHAKRNVLARINALLKPFTRFIYHIGRIGATGGDGSSFLKAVQADVFATLALSPATSVAIIVFAIISLCTSVASLREGVVPAIVVALVIALADIATRDHSAGMLNLLFTAPGLKVRYVAWKFASAFVVTLCFTLIPMLRLFSDIPSAALSLLIGSCLLAAGAIGCGVFVRSQKLFIALFLMLLYIALNAREVPGIDFAGFNGRATPGVQAGYAILTALLLVLSHTKHKLTLGRK